MFFAQLLHNSNNFFLRSTIENLRPACRKINQLFDKKKKKKKKKLELYNKHY
jgi:predicted chitinase